MNKIIIVLIFTLITLSNNSFSQVTQEWVRTYNGPASSDDAAKSLAMDGSGNVYVTGYSTGIGTLRDYLTFKYNSAGVLLWEARYNGPDNNNDEASSIAVDGSGNVYVTGKSIKSGVNSDFVTIKYNSAGVQQWLARYDQFATDYDAATSIAVDGSGNVYVTGYTQYPGYSHSSDYATIKYNSSGVELWVKRYNGGYGTDAASSIAVDGLGNVYVTGLSAGIGTLYDYATIKYNPLGDEQWVKRYNGPGNNYDMANSLAIDGLGNVYVTGSSYGIGTNVDYATIKYTPSGAEQWVSRYNGPANYDDRASSLKVDGSGNVYVTGQSTGIGTSYDYATIKYNPLGDEQWVKRYNGPGNNYDIANSLAVDGSGNVYVTGNSAGIGTYWDYATIKYTASGAEQWVSRYNGPAGIGDDVASSIAVDGSGNVYVTGRIFGTTYTHDYGTIKYSQTGKKLIGGISVSDSFIEPELPKDYSLAQNFPNPFNPSTIIKFSMPVEGNVVISVSDINGKEISQLLDQRMTAGYHEVNFDGSNLSSGIYFYKITTSNFTDVKKMILVK